MWSLDQVVGIIHASQDWHGLDGDHELVELKVSIEVLGELG